MSVAAMQIAEKKVCLIQIGEESGKLDEMLLRQADLVVSPRITADQACVYDQLTKYCTGRQ
jgi:hypothetical protein